NHPSRKRSVPGMRARGTERARSRADEHREPTASEHRRTAAPTPPTASTGRRSEERNERGAEQMNTASAGSWSPARGGLAILCHPDRDSAWVVLAAADVPQAPPPSVLADRLTGLCAALPVVGARLAGGRWQAGSPPAPREAADPLADPRLLSRFDLAAE